jgi:glycosyltransferase involved in cell wall biosynthesis
MRVIARLNVGGPAIHATLLTRRLDRSRYDSMLVAGHEGPQEGSYEALYGESSVAPVRLASLGRELHGWRDVRAVRELVGLMRKFRPHVVHTHTAKAGAVGRVAARLAGVPVVVHTYHGHVLSGYFSPLKTRVFVGIERSLARVSSRLLTVSATVRQQLLDFGIGSKEKLTLLPLGLDLEKFRSAARLRGQMRAEYGWSDDAPLVGIVARLVPIKAHEMFLDTAAEIAAVLPQARFLVVGDGERRAELERLAAARGLRESVIFTGWRSDLDRVYADLDVVMLTSRNEGSPVSLIEAMAAGRAVVATRVGGVPDLVTDDRTGRLVASGDTPAAARAVLELLHHPGRRAAFGSAAREQVYPHYSAERLVDDIDRLYMDLLKK